jgi:predicted O-methyltransferase YrrM
MTQISRFIRVVQRRLVNYKVEEGHILPLIEPLFMIDTHLTYDERMALFSLGLSLPTGFVACEIGSYVGASTSFLVAAACLRQGHVHAVDTWKNDAMHVEPVEDTWNRFLDNTDRFRNWITPHRGMAREVKDRVPNFDFLFIDGDHSYEGTLENLRDFIPKLNEGGVVTMHDVHQETVQNAISSYFSERQTEDLGMTHSLKTFRPK